MSLKKVILLGLLTLFANDSSRLYGNTFSNIDPNPRQCVHLDFTRGHQETRGKARATGQESVECCQGSQGAIDPTDPTSTIAKSLASSTNTTPQSVSQALSPVTFTNDRFTPVGITHDMAQWTKFTAISDGIYSISWSFMVQPDVIHLHTDNVSDTISAGLRITSNEGKLMLVKPFPQFIQSLFVFPEANVSSMCHTLSGSSLIHLSALDSVELMVQSSLSERNCPMLISNPMISFEKIAH